MKSARYVLVVLLVLLGVILPIAVTSETLTWQARLQDSDGVNVDGPVTAGFRIYETLSGSTVLWGETHSLTADQGIIHVELGSVNTLPSDLFAKPGIYLGITVAGDPEMSPRRLLAGTWKAMSAERAGGKLIQAGEGTLSVSGVSNGSAAITFPRPFSSAPVVMIGALHAQIGSADFIPTQVTGITTTGCTASFSSLDGSIATGSANFDWIAIGD